MRIPCPHCGARDVQEFTYLGDAGLQRPDGLAATEAAMFDYVYLRDNLRGLHEELWYHGAGCHAWLAVRRHTLTHAIESAVPAKSRWTGAAA
ncbi:sarcosine oxidase subunit delta [Bradyrhizobium sp. 4]|uniref:sarcosine oxidase subunit delta n=1 Tax=unclassified Bradyrhizobium TaxID=2631580 RepID=UPI001FF789FB|nr:MULTISPECIES: sarcosine oxidase subunit delta [unclassified Bradyrhizobium]MCK1396794.1 sarcosine oxidase subunit delta [Bradyrhizobium sp. 39]MCK1520083.1 sarcosine oxidase subunit delta [Bradyrhizobium sp. 17]MCK1635227.1 sarcosine oxidase subunit delta [Bradyrhizobium sp. 162]MCK1752241.1 sarcosine oxidase subunit delta [Bradyrhizobium sp. 135]UPJ36331.1 sarcosine oxidase subunit delta [Bradyrhizobium sp. 4]